MEKSASDSQAFVHAITESTTGLETQVFLYHNLTQLIERNRREEEHPYAGLFVLRIGMPHADIPAPFLRDVANAIRNHDAFDHSGYITHNSAFVLARRKNVDAERLTQEVRAYVAPLTESYFINDFSVAHALVAPNEDILSTLDKLLNL